MKRLDSGCLEGRANQPARVGKEVRKREMSITTSRLSIRANAKIMLWMKGFGVREEKFSVRDLLDRPVETTSRRSD